MTKKPQKLTLHIGEDYGVAMLPKDTTDSAAIHFGPNVDDVWCIDVVRQLNAFPIVEDAIAASVAYWAARDALIDFQREQPNNIGPAWQLRFDQEDEARVKLSAALRAAVAALRVTAT